MANVSGVWIGWYCSPAEELLTCRRNFFCNDGFAVFAFGCGSRQEDNPSSIFAGLWQLDTEIGTGYSREKLVGKASQDAGAVTCVLLVTDTAAMHHTAIYVPRLLNDFAAGTPLNVTDKAYAAGVLLKRRIIAPMPFWQAD